MARAIINLPAVAKAGDVVEVKILVQHAMETGYRLGSDGAALPRDLVRRVEARFEGEMVFAADLHAAIAANPYLAFHLRVPGAGTLTVVWQGDNGFAHSESVRMRLA